MSAITGTSTAAPSNSGDGLSAFTNDEFLQLIFAELTNQDPLAPSETKDLIEQISTIRAIESDEQFANRFDDLVDQNQLTVSSSLIGKFVTGLDQFNTEVLGFVDSVLVTDRGTILNLSNDAQVPVDNITEVIDPALISLTDPDAPVPATGGGDPVASAGGTGGNNTGTTGAGTPGTDPVNNPQTN